MTPSSFLSTNIRIAALLALGATLAHAQEVQTVKIAHAGPTSGGIAHIGKDTENGVR
ncbi:MAG: branched-chain amino acid ABC transporter substrate-binding protein, partial [Polaromonas sp.]